MKFLISFKPGLILLAVVFNCQFLISQNSTYSYLPTSTIIANPERGWYEDYYSFSNFLTGSYKLLDSTVLKTSRENKKVTIILRLFYLHQFLNETSVSADYLAKMQADFNAVRSAGDKCIVRFAYSDSQGAAIWDATPDKVMSHIESLRQVLVANSDIIMAVQAGFIGAWGEWYYTKNFARSGYNPDATDQTNRRLLVEALLNILPENIQVQVRTPAIKKNVAQSADPIADSEAYDGSIKSRIGHHDDCFVANGTDYGTYTNVAQDIAYLSQETKFAIAGGETCDASNMYSDCDHAVPRMKELHWTYLNMDYNQKVYDKWISQGCINEANLGLGYRIYLESALIPDSCKQGTEINMTFHLKNVGFAAPTQFKPVQVVLKNTQTTEQYILPFSSPNNDIRFWLPGEIDMSGKIAIPASLPNGNYKTYLRFPDKASTLESNPAYSIQLANIGMWLPEEGLNELGHILVAGNGGEGSIPAAPQQLMASAFSDSQIDLSWSAAAGSDGVEIYRCIYENDEWTKVAMVPAEFSSFSDEGLYSGTIYSYLIRSVNSFGNSGWSEKVSATTVSNSIEMKKDNVLNIYPNPFKRGELNIHTGFNSHAEICISDISGKNVYSAVSEGSHIRLDGIVLQPGLYLLQLKTGQTSFSRRLVIN